MISVVIPVYKKTELFLKNLHKNIVFLKDCEVIVVNDDPETSINSRLNNFDVVLIENKENLGFGGAVNAGVKKAKGKYFMLINSDVVLENNDFVTAVEHFKNNSNLFAVGFAQKEKDGRIVGKNVLYLKGGIFQHKAAANQTSGITGWAEGGACLIDREKFQYLGGFDDLYSPFYWEDVDLSYRAWKSGYEVMFDSGIVVEHFHESTIGSYFTPREIKITAYRNQFIFIWKNITDSGLFWKNILLLKLTCLLTLLTGDVLFSKGYYRAIKKLPEILKKKINSKKIFCLY